MMLLAIDLLTEQAPAISLAFEPPEAGAYTRVTKYDLIILSG
jgi:hypothetical protein